MGLAELKADAKLLRDQYAQSEGDFDARRELAENFLPLLMGILDGVIANDAEIRDEVADLGEAVDDLIDDTGDVLHPETTTKIVGLIEVGKLLANELAAMLPKLDDVSKKRIAQLVKTYRQGAEVVGPMLIEITMPVEPEADAAKGGVDDEEGDEDEDDDELEEGEEGDDEDDEDEEDEDDGQTVGG